MYGAGFDSLCIGSERDPVAHSRMKRSLAPAFSTKALAEQEGIVQKCIDEFVHKISPEGAGQNALNMTEWFEMIAFDILGEMAFGESFHSVEQGMIRLLLTSSSLRLYDVSATQRCHNIHVSALLILNDIIIMSD